MGKKDSKPSTPPAKSSSTKSQSSSALDSVIGLYLQVFVTAIIIDALVLFAAFYVIPHGITFNNGLEFGTDVTDRMGIYAIAVLMAVFLSIFQTGFPTLEFDEQAREKFGLVYAIVKTLFWFSAVVIPGLIAFFASYILGDFLSYDKSTRSIAFVGAKIAAMIVLYFKAWLPMWASSPAKTKADLQGDVTSVAIYFTLQSIFLGFSWNFLRESVFGSIGM